MSCTIWGPLMFYFIYLFPFTEVRVDWAHSDQLSRSFKSWCCSSLDLVTHTSSNTSLKSKWLSICSRGQLGTRAKFWHQGLHHRTLIQPVTPPAPRFASSSSCILSRLILYTRGQHTTFHSTPWMLICGIHNGGWPHVRQHWTVCCKGNVTPSTSVLPATITIHAVTQ